MNMQKVAIRMLIADRKAQADASHRELIAKSRAHVGRIHHENVDKHDKTTPHVKRHALGEKACGPMIRLRRKKNRAERIAARNLAR